MLKLFCRMNGVGTPRETAMACFTDFQDYLFLCSGISPEEKEKREPDGYLPIPEDSGAGRTITEASDEDTEKGGRPSCNPHRLFAAVLYAFSKHSGSLRR